MSHLQALVARVPADSTFEPMSDADVEQSIAARFAAQVRRHGDRIAVRTRQTTWTYRELDARAGAIAGALVSRLGAGQDRVALLFEHDAVMVAGVIGALQAGKPYVPLDASYPAERLAYMLHDAECRVLVTNAANRALAEQLAQGRVPVLMAEELMERGSRAEVVVDPMSPAYLLYTSGSTGRPKAVVQINRNVLHHMRVWVNVIKVSPNDRLSLQSAYSWDSAVQDTLGALLTGATLCPIHVKAEGLPGVIELLERHEITVYHSTLPVFRDVARALAARGRTLPSIRVAALGGDFIYRDDVELLRRSFPPTAVLMNCYGATESSSALMNICDRSSQLPGTVVPLGYPVHDTEVYLLDDSGNRVTGVGGQGEIVLRSRYLSPGYLPPSVPEAARFRPDPEGGERRVYHTGDLGRYVEDGSILLIGRKDFQVKISGIRVELGEVEGALKELGGVADAVVAAREDVPGERYLAAYVVLEPGRALTVDLLRRELARTVPEHAVPSVYVFLDALPRTPNNKIDRGALQAPERTRPRLGNTYVAPASRHEQIIAEIWCEVLGLDDCGIDDNFFDLGGSSMRLLAVNQRLRAALNRDIPMVEMYRNPTIRALVASLNLQGQSSTAAERGAARGARRARWSKRGRSET